MSRSCHSATFSSAGATAERIRRDSPVRFSVLSRRSSGVSCADITVHIRAKNGWSSVFPAARSVTSPL